MENKTHIPYKEIEVGQERYFCDVELSFGTFQIKRYFVKITEIKKQVAKYYFLKNNKVTSPHKINEMNTWASDKELMKKYFIEKLEKNLIDFKNKLSWYTEKYPKLKEHKLHISSIEYLISNVERIFSEDVTFSDDLQNQQGFYKTESIMSNGGKSIMWSKKGSVNKRKQ